MKKLVGRDLISTGLFSGGVPGKERAGFERERGPARAEGAGGRAW